MEQKQLKMINKAYDSLYDLNSKYGLFPELMKIIEDYMGKEGYKVHINSFDKCVFKKI